jgi:2'-5' RNA ligase
MRLFAAIFPPESVLPRISAVAKAVNILHTSAIAVKQEKMHVTLQFFGDADLEECSAKIDKAVALFPESFDVSLDHVDAFPLRKTARVIFAGAENPEPIVRLMKALMTKRPHAHLTLARLPKPRTVKLMQIEPITFRADRVVLVNSVLGENAKYEILREWPLK